VIEATLVDHSKTREVLQRRYFWVLATLLFLFCLRVIGQILVAFFNVSFLPPMEEWFSGLLPYPELLTAQILIIALYGKICLDFSRGHGFFSTPRRSLGTGLLVFGSLYLSVMVIRYHYMSGGQADASPSFFIGYFPLSSLCSGATTGEQLHGPRSPASASCFFREPLR
jgi:hypothetical protein